MCASFSIYNIFFLKISMDLVGKAQIPLNCGLSSCKTKITSKCWWLEATLVEWWPESKYPTKHEMQLMFCLRSVSLFLSECQLLPFSFKTSTMWLQIRKNYKICCIGRALICDIWVFWLKIVNKVGSEA